MLSVTSLAVIVLALLSVVSTVIGVGLAFYFKKSVRGIVWGIGFSTGIMLLVSCSELLPESISSIGFAPTFVAFALGIVFIGILNFIIPHTHLGEGKNGRERRLLKIAWLIVFGLILHDFPEGFAMATSYIHEPSLGIFVALAIALHNIPEEFAMAVPLLLTKKKKLIFKTAILSALAEPAGAVLGLVAVEFLPSLSQQFMAFAAGTMVFVSLHELWPMAKSYGKNLFFFLGIFFSVAVYLGLSGVIAK